MVTATPADPWLTAMLAGNFEAAWLVSDQLRAARAAHAPDPHRFWDGESLHGKRVIVRCLHGLGDAVQMMRYAPLLNSVAASVLWEVPPRMLEFARCFRGVEHVITWGDDAPSITPKWDSQIECMELPYLFRTTQSDLPLATRYCRLSPGVNSLRGPSSSSLQVGLVWAAGEWNPERGLPYADLAPLLSLANVCFINLQGGASRNQGAGLIELPCEGLEALAAAIASLDLVLTVDTLAAHLAGALGKPVWLMLQHAADWRWLAAGERSPWYPTMRLFRQQHPGDWPGVIAQVRQALQEQR